MTRKTVKAAAGLAALALALGDRCDGRRRVRRTLCAAWAARGAGQAIPSRRKAQVRPLLLIHGFGTSTYTWRRVAPELATNHRVIAVDLKGFGQSDKPMDERYSVFDQAELLAQLIEDRNLRDLTLVGHSFGGGVALLLALEADQRLKGRISRLVLLNTIAYPQNMPVFFRMLNMPFFSHVGVRMVPPAVQTRVALKIAYHDDSKIDDSEVEVYAGPLKTAAGKHAMIQSARQIVPERSRRARRTLQVDRPADVDPVVRPRPHRAARRGAEAASRAAERVAQSCAGLRTHAARGAALADARVDAGLPRRLTVTEVFRARPRSPLCGDGFLPQLARA